jgi:hypothetical protein
MWQVWKPNGKTIDKKNVYTIQDWVGLFDEQGENLLLSS